MRGEGEPSRKPVAWRHVELPSTSLFDCRHGSLKCVGIQELAAWLSTELCQIESLFTRNGQLVCLWRLHHVCRGCHAQVGRRECGYQRAHQPQNVC